MGEFLFGFLGGGCAGVTLALRSAACLAFSFGGRGEFALLDRQIFQGLGGIVALALAALQVCGQLGKALFRLADRLGDTLFLALQAVALQQKPLQGGRGLGCSVAQGR